jgi:dTDP-4-amino-4,6-dideoxygalactose transaminase
MPRLVQGSESVYHLFPVCHARRDEITDFLKDRGVAAGVHYPVPCHLQPAYASLGHKEGDFPVAERIAKHTLSLPMFPEMTRQQLDHVCKTLEQFFTVAASAS